MKAEGEKLEDTGNGSTAWPPLKDWQKSPTLEELVAQQGVKPFPREPDSRRLDSWPEDDTEEFLTWLDELRGRIKLDQAGGE